MAPPLSKKRVYGVVGCTRSPWHTASSARMGVHSGGIRRTRGSMGAPETGTARSVPIVHRLRVVMLERNQRVHALVPETLEIAGEIRHAVHPFPSPRDVPILGLGTRVIIRVGLVIPPVIALHRRGMRSPPRLAHGS